MGNKYDDKLYNIAKDIAECHECFKTSTNCPYFVPDGPDFETEQKKKKIMLVGINPGMPNWFTYENYSVEYKNLYEAKKTKDKSNIIDAIMSLKEKKDTNGNPCEKKSSIYSRNLTPLLNNINKIIKDLFIDNKNEIKEEEFYDHVYWANASFCPSPNAKECSEEIRIKNDKNDAIYIKNIKERIKKCTDKNFLSSLINLIEPKMILVVGLADYMNGIVELIKNKIMGEEYSKEKIEDTVCRWKSNKDATGCLTTKILTTKFTKENDEKYILQVTHPSCPHGAGFKICDHRIYENNKNLYYLFHKNLEQSKISN